MKSRLLPFLLGFTMLSGAAMAADGCPDGTFSIVTAPDGLAATVLFDIFFVTGGGGGPTTAQATCQLEVFTPAPDGFAVWTADYRGFAQLDADQLAALTAIGGVPEGTTIAGPYADLYDFTQLVGTGPTEPLTIDAILDLVAELGPDALATVDTVDFARIGFTTWDSVKASIDQLATEQAAVVAHIGATANLLLGFLDPLEGPTEAGPVAAIGSGLFGGTGRFNFGNGFSVIGGAGFFSQSAAGFDIGYSLLVAGALRYVQPDTSTFRMFGEVGAIAAPSLDLHFERQYENNGVLVTGAGDTTGSLLGLYARLGALFALNPGNALALSVTLAHNRLHVDAYSEPVSMANLFAAHVEETRDGTGAIKATAAWTHALGEEFDLTVAAAVGRSFGGPDILANVDWVGPVTGEATNRAYVEVGARVGWNVGEAMRVDGFVIGATGPSIGTHGQVGGAVHFAF